MEISLKEIAELVNGEIVGNQDVIIKGVGGIKEAEDGVIESPGEGKADFYCISVKKADEIYEINSLEGKCT